MSGWGDDADLSGGSTEEKRIAIPELPKLFFLALA
jgi:hypothetical protein